jgi:hypothetical protein
VRPYGARHPHPSAAFLARTVRSSHARPLIVDQKQHCGRRLLSAHSETAPLARRCPCDNEGRSASAVASGPSVAPSRLEQQSAGRLAGGCFCGRAEERRPQRQASAIPRERERRADRRGHLQGRKSGSATCLLIARGLYDRQAAGHCRFVAKENLDHQ